jgi:type I restriction enzyme S subunit
MNAQQLKNAILQEAIEGRLVPQDPNDEPASALLARIRKEKERLVKAGKLKKKYLEVKPISEDEIPFEIPESWEWCKLGWIGDWGAGATPAKGNSDFYNNGTIPWLRTGELNNGFVYDSEIKVTPKALEKCSLRMCEIGDVLIAMYGATIGKVAIAGIKLTTNQACCACTPYHVYNKYLLYYLMASKKTFIEMGEGGAQPNISREKIVAFPFALPPLNEQHRIVAKIEELLPKVEEYGKAQDALNKLNAELPERLKKSILQEAIEGRLVPQDPNDEPASVLLVQIRKEKERLVKEGKLKKKDLIETPISEDEIPFEIPDSWKWVRLGDVTEIARGGSPRPIKEYLTDAPNGLNWIKIGDTDKGGKYINSCKEKIKPEGLKKTRMVHPGDFLLTNSMSFGRPYITNIEGCIHDGWLMISPYAGVFDQSFLFYVLSSAFAHKQFCDKVAGAVVQNLNSDKVADSYVPIPPLAEQHRIVEKLEQLLGEIDKLKK